MERKRSEIFLVMKEGEDLRYSLYRVGESQLASADYSDDQTPIPHLGKPILKMDKSTFVQGMSFAVVGSRIFMIGGYYHDNNNQKTCSDKDFIYDTVSSSLTSGPTLVSGKKHPLLLTVGTKIYALSNFIYCAERVNSAIDPEPRFEVLDTENLECGWSALPAPKLCIPLDDYIFPVVSCAAVYVGSGGLSGVIFISVENAGTHAFDADKRVWKHVTDEMLPFSGQAISMPRTPHLPFGPYLCCATSDKSERFSAFRFRYAPDQNNNYLGDFHVDEFPIDLPPCRKVQPGHLYQNPSTQLFDSSGRVYFVVDGVDDIDGIEDLEANRIVNVWVLDIHNVKSSKKPVKKNKKGLMDAVAQHKNVKVALGRGHSLKRCQNMKNEQVGHAEEPDETLGLKMTQLWNITFDGGEMCEIRTHVYAALAI